MVALMVQDVQGNYVQADNDLVIAAAIGIAEKRVSGKKMYCSPDTVAEHFKILMANLEHEVFYVMYMDSQHMLIECEQMSRGTISSTAVYPREIAKSALKHNAAAIIVAHNHPSGSTEPSGADKVITGRIIEAMSLVDVRVLDHIIVGGHRTSSFAAMGLL